MGETKWQEDHAEGKQEGDISVNFNIYSNNINKLEEEESPPLTRHYQRPKGKQKFRRK